MPIRIVMRHPLGSLPGIKNFATAPTINPMISVPIKLNIGTPSESNCRIRLRHPLIPSESQMLATIERSIEFDTILAQIGESSGKVASQKKAREFGQILMLKFLAGALEFDSSGAERFRNIFIGAEPFEIEGIEHGKHVESDIERCFRIVHQITNDRIVFAEIAIVGDHAKNFVSEIRHAGIGF